MLVELLVIGVVALLGYVLTDQYKKRHMLRLGDRLPGPRRLPLIGNVFKLPNNGAEGLKMRKEIIAEYGHLTAFWIGTELFVAISDPIDIEVILNNTTFLEKGRPYKYMEPWLGSGLLLSSGEKWHQRRKAITPAFHFKILEQFIKIFNKNGNTLLEVIEKEAGGGIFDLQPYISRFALDVICETAMGVEVNAQTDTKSPYVQAVSSLCQVVFRRINKPWLWSDWAFAISGYLRSQMKALDILHGFTDRVIQEKKRDRRTQADSGADINEDLGEKKKSAFLESLLKLSEESKAVFKTDKDIREEVDTFMFEGHDTTTAAICCTLCLLSKHQDIQDKLVEEIRSILPGVSHDLTYQELQQFKYMECVIKEALRIYPSVPVVSRQMTEDFKLPSGHVLPAGALAVISFFFLHRNEKYFPEPEVFNPDNFLPERSVGRHPFAFLPFSAGPRNCIGQKFAMLEMKATLAKFLLRYRVEYAGPEWEIEPNPTLVLRSLNGYKIKLTNR